MRKNVSITYVNTLRTIFGQTFGLLRILQPFVFALDGILSLLLLGAAQEPKFYMVSKCLQKCTWASREPFPSDNLRTTFRQPSDTFWPLQNGIWAGRIELLDASPTCKKLASHMLAYELVDLMLKLIVSCSNPIGHVMSYDLGQKCCRVGRSRKL